MQTRQDQIWELIAAIKRDALQFGDFTLASGQKSSFYLDCRKVTLTSRGLDLVSQIMVQRLWDEPARVSAIGGLELGAVPIVGGMLVEASLYEIYNQWRGFIVRKKAKEHGGGKLVEGSLDAKDVVVIVEDVTTTGESAMQAVRAVRDLGAQVHQVMSIVDREQGAVDLFKAEGIPFHPLVALTDLGIRP